MLSVWANNEGKAGICSAGLLDTVTIWKSAKEAAAAGPAEKEPAEGFDTGKASGKNKMEALLCFLHPDKISNGSNS